MAQIAPLLQARYRFYIVIWTGDRLLQRRWTSAKYRNFRVWQLKPDRS